jgi:hypothetical protein
MVMRMVVIHFSPSAQTITDDNAGGWFIRIPTDIRLSATIFELKKKLHELGNPPPETMRLLMDVDGELVNSKNGSIVNGGIKCVLRDEDTLESNLWIQRYCEMDQLVIFARISLFDEEQFKADQGAVYLPEGQRRSPRTMRRYEEQELRIASELVSERKRWCNVMPYYDFLSQATHDEFVRVFAAAGHNEIVQNYLQFENN